MSGWINIEIRNIAPSVTFRLIQVIDRLIPQYIVIVCVGRYEIFHSSKQQQAAYAKYERDDLAPSPPHPFFFLNTEGKMMLDLAPEVFKYMKSILTQNSPCILDDIIKQLKEVHF